MLFKSTVRLVLWVLFGAIVLIVLAALAIQLHANEIGFNQHASGSDRS
jgi:hypothetical protein